jgi:hypothetical protein
MNIFFPVNIFIFNYKYSFKRLLFLFRDKKLVIQFTVPAVIYTIETILLSWCLLNVPISVYIIGRTSSSFFNVLFYKYYIKKNIPWLYYCGLIFLVIAYILLGINYTDFATNIKTIFSVIFLIFSGFTTSLYNNMVEKHLDDFTKKSNEQLTDLDSVSNLNYEISQHDRTIKYSKMEVQLFYQIIANIYGFIFICPIAIGFCIAPTIQNQKDIFQTLFLPNFLFVITGISYQIYFLFKILLLGHTQIAGNQVVSGLDLSRRVFINILAYTAFREYYNSEIIGANICMFVGSLLFVLGQINMNFRCLKKSNTSSTIQLESIIKEEIEYMNGTKNTEEIELTSLINQH